MTGLSNNPLSLLESFHDVKRWNALIVLGRMQLKKVNNVVH